MLATLRHHLPLEGGKKAKGKGKRSAHQATDLIETGPIDCDLYVQHETEEEAESDSINMFAADNQIAGLVGLQGTLCCSAVVPHRSTVGVAVDAIKMDVLRSIYARTELHYESMSVIENEDYDPEAIHQFPRRVLAPAGPSVKYSDYLFDADVIEDAVKNFADILDLDVDEARVQDDIERVMDTDMLADLNVALPKLTSTPSDSDKKSSSRNGGKFQADIQYIEQLVGKADESDQRLIMMVVAGIVAVVGVILALILASSA